MVSETLRLSAHEKFIIDGIKRQAGTVEKAVLELVMNAIEAQLHQSAKPKVEINFSVEEDQAKLVVRDSGRGFKSRVEVEEWFAKFGTPHDECPECKKTMKLKAGGMLFVCGCGYSTEGRTWAEFRMGRGQAMSFGRVVYRTGKFRMEYDLETDPDKRSYAKPIPPQSEWEVNAEGEPIDPQVNHVLDFALQSNLPNHKGCEVTVYFYDNPIPSAYRSLDAFKSKIKHHVEFIEGEITFNGEQINTPASECKWDIETGDAYFMFGKGSNLSLYNIGAFVNDFSAADMGVTGVVVSKDKMMVNFARNDVQQRCPVWQRIRIIITENKIKKVRRASRRLNENERISTLQDIRDGDVQYSEVKNIGLFELTDGKVMSLEAVRKIRSHWTFADPGDRIADRLMQTDTAICFSRETVEALDYSGDEQNFFGWLLKEYAYDIPNGWDKITPFYRTFDDVSGGYSNTHSIIPTNKLSKAERRFLTVMERFNKWNGRTLCIGVSDTAHAWTDGRTFIAFNRAYLRRHNPQYHYGAAKLVTLAVHELAHDEDDTGSHLHKVEFYQKYHDLTRGSILHIIGELPGKMRGQKWQDHAAEVAERDAKKKAQRDRALGIKRTVAADGITAKPKAPKAPKAPRAPKAKKRRLRRF
jgi:hypothetical protein